MLSENGWFVFNFWGEGGGGCGLNAARDKTKILQLVGLFTNRSLQEFCKNSLDRGIYY